MKSKKTINDPKPEDPAEMCVLCSRRIEKTCWGRGCGAQQKAEKAMEDWNQRQRHK